MRVSMPVVCVVGALALTSCAATFEPRLQSLESLKGRLPTVRQVQGGVEVSLEEFFTPGKSRRAFDAEVGAAGVLPLLVRVENHGLRSYRLRRDRVAVYRGDEPLLPLEGRLAAAQGAARDAVWNSLVNTAALGPLAIYWGVASLAATASQTQAVNRKIEHHFESLELQDTLVKPDETVLGFAYFSLPRATGPIADLRAEIVLEEEPAENGEERLLAYQLALPPLSDRPGGVP
ncbi:MAG TPA: hypothetical protein VNN77_14150 [candidate division Zixibacteria bacterium]|nr:hypothetical protein [candidate division Zixibacteria bacterium]